MQAQEQKDVNYRVEYNSTCSGGPSVNPDPLPLTVSAFDTALHIMEQAATMDGSYQFSATFSEADGTVGYFVESIGGTSSDAPCYWNFYVQSGGVEVAPSVGVDAYVPGNNFDVIMRYEPAVSSPSITTTYVIEHPDRACTSATPPNTIRITTPTGSTALHIMEEAVRENGPMYRFATRYSAVGSGYGYTVWQVGNVSNSGNCDWAVFVTAPNGVESPLSEPVSVYTLPATEYTLTLKFSEASVTTDSVATTRGGAIVSGCMLYAVKPLKFGTGLLTLEERLALLRG